MRHLDRINKIYDQKEIELLYNKAVSLMDLLSDDEYEQLITANVDVFGIASHPEKGVYYLQDKDNLKKILSILTEYIQTKGLSRDEFNVMTLDEVKAYMVDVINSITVIQPDEVFTLIKNLEKIV